MQQRNDKFLTLYNFLQYYNKYINKYKIKYLQISQTINLLIRGRLG